MRAVHPRALLQAQPRVTPSNPPGTQPRAPHPDPPTGVTYPQQVFPLQRTFEARSGRGCSTISEALLGPPYTKPEESPRLSPRPSWVLQGGHALAPEVTAATNLPVRAAAFENLPKGGGGGAWGTTKPNENQTKTPTLPSAARSMLSKTRRKPTAPMKQPWKGQKDKGSPYKNHHPKGQREPRGLCPFRVTVY